MVPRLALDLSWVVNFAVVDILKVLYSRLMHLVRLLVFATSMNDFWFVASHINRAHNTRADALSRNNALYFLSKARARANPGSVGPSRYRDIIY